MWLYALASQLLSCHSVCCCQWWGVVDSLNIISLGCAQLLFFFTGMLRNSSWPMQYQQIVYRCGHSFFTRDDCCTVQLSWELLGSSPGSKGKCWNCRKNTIEYFIPISAIVRRYLWCPVQQLSNVWNRHLWFYNNKKLLQINSMFVFFLNPFHVRL